MFYIDEIVNQLNAVDAMWPGAAVHISPAQEFLLGVAEVAVVGLEGEGKTLESTTASRVGSS